MADKIQRQRQGPLYPTPPGTPTYGNRGQQRREMKRKPFNPYDLTGDASYLKGMADQYKAILASAKDTARINGQQMVPDANAFAQALTRQAGPLDDRRRNAMQDVAFGLRESRAGQAMAQERVRQQTALQGYFDRLRMEDEMERQRRAQGGPWGMISGALGSFL